MKNLSVCNAYLIRKINKEYLYNLWGFYNFHRIDLVILIVVLLIQVDHTLKSLGKMVQSKLKILLVVKVRLGMIKYIIKIILEEIIILWMMKKEKKLRFQD